MDIIIPKIGLFFGSFNPVHIGHLIIAIKSLEIKKLDAVWFIVSPQNPHKKIESLLPAEERVKMLQLALKNNKGYLDKWKFQVSDIELKMPIPSYTVDTLRELKKTHPTSEFYIIMGMDSFKSIDTWKDYKEIIENNKMLVFDRVGHDHDKEELLKAYPNLEFLSIPSFELSSTYIRSQIKENKSIKFMVPDNVIDYIKRNNLYTSI